VCHSEEAMTGIGVKLITFAVYKFSPHGRHLLATELQLPAYDLLSGGSC
jgi:hypothetical protein